MSKKKPNMNRDVNIFKSYQREINLSSKVIKDKTKYSRKSKHSNTGDKYESL